MGPIGLILGLIGFFQAKKAKKLCSENPGLYSNAGNANAGYICSLIGFILGILASLYLLFIIVLVVLSVAGAAASGP